MALSRGEGPGSRVQEEGQAFDNLAGRKSESRSTGVDTFIDLVCNGDIHCLQSIFTSSVK